MSRHSEDCYDDDTRYQAVVCDEATKEEVKVFFRSHLVSYNAWHVEGKMIVGVEFSPDSSELLIKYEGWTTDSDKLPGSD